MKALKGKREESEEPGELQKPKEGRKGSLGDLKKAKMGGFVSLGECQTTNGEGGGVQAGPKEQEDSDGESWGALKDKRGRSRASGRDPKRSTREGF